MRICRSDQEFAVLCLDLDRFKIVNDTLGHLFGDMLLRQVAGRMSGCLREGDTLARLGGDEFAILQGSIKQPSDVIALAARLFDATSAPFDLEGHQVVIGVSIGIAIAPTDAADADQLLKNADMALYRAKADGRGTYRFFEPEMDALMQARRALGSRPAQGLGQRRVRGLLPADRRALKMQAHHRLRSAHSLEPSRHADWSSRWSSFRWRRKPD